MLGLIIQWMIYSESKKRIFCEILTENWTHCLL